MHKQLHSFVKIATSSLTQNLLRNTLLIVAAMFALIFLAIQIASADPAQVPLDATKSPITGPIQVTVNCDETWNPTCRSVATTTPGVKLWSSLYIDGRLRDSAHGTGTVNETFTNVCHLYRLQDGTHTARVTARDAYGNTAGVGPYRVIKCDRTPPGVTIGYKSVRHVVSINPKVTDRMSGVKEKHLFIDQIERTWEPSSNVCTTFSLSSGPHLIKATATDNAGNSSYAMRVFFCQ
jgi:hypothetical protein